MNITPVTSLIGELWKDKRRSDDSEGCGRTRPGSFVLRFVCVAFICEGVTFILC